MVVAYLGHEVKMLAAARSFASEEAYNAWFDQSDIKLRVKKAMMVGQKLRCCYCQRYIAGNASLWDLEHVLCESVYPQFFSDLLNLAVSCRQCNGHKKQKDMRAGRAACPATVPSIATDYVIPHPNFTTWSAHLSHTDYLIYEGHSDEGRELIPVCELNSRAELQSGQPPGAARVAIETNWFATVRVDLPAVTLAQAVAVSKKAIEDHYDKQAAPELKKLNAWLASAAKPKSLQKKVNPAAKHASLIQPILDHLQTLSAPKPTKAKRAPLNPSGRSKSKVSPKKTA